MLPSLGGGGDVFYGECVEFALSSSTLGSIAASLVLRIISRKLE